jgi:hypothetical protein
MELLTFIHRFIFSLRALFLIFIAIPLLLCSVIAQAAYTQVIRTEHVCSMVDRGGNLTLTCTPVVRVEYVWVPDPAPPPQPTSAPPPPPKCNVIAAENELASQKCNQTALGSKAGHSAYCGSLPAVAYKDIGVGVDIGKIITATINGKVQEEYRPQESCLRVASDVFEVKAADCKVKESERKLIAVKLGCN